MNNKERFLELCQEIKREGVDRLIEFLENSDFFSAPASTRFHGAHEGGLLEHSLNVYDELCRLLEAYPEVQPSHPDSAIIAALFHDLCKVNTYGVEKRNRKNESGKWESYDAYVSDEKFHFGGHGSKSVYILQNYIRIYPDEAVAINAHMGVWDGNTLVGAAYEQYPFAWLTHVADEAATYIKEGKH